MRKVVNYYKIYYLKWRTRYCDIKKREQLSVLQIEDNGDVVDFDTIATVLFNKPSNILYCEKNGQLHGIISMGDVHRAKENRYNVVAINKSFTYLQGYEYMRARKIFLGNDKINALPIVDEVHRLLGDYSRWVDAFSEYEFDYLKGNRFADIAWERYKKIGIVIPSVQSTKKKICFERWSDFFKSIGIVVQHISKNNIVDAFDNNDILFFMDEDELKGLGIFYDDILGKTFHWEKARTFKDAKDAITDAIAEVVLKDIVDNGVHILTLDITENKTTYWENLNRNFINKYTTIGKKHDFVLYEEFWRDFYGDVYSYDYAREVSNQSCAVCADGLITKLKDEKSKYYNVADGERLTVGQPTQFYKTIYFFGPCIAIGPKVKDAHTIESQLQEILNNNNIPIRVVNYGSWQNEFQLIQRICSTNFRKGDIAIIYDQNKRFKDIPFLNIGECLEQNNIPATWFIEWAAHGNHKVYNMWANEIYNHLPKKWLQRGKNSCLSDWVEFPIDTLVSCYVERYFENKIFEGEIGSIVMNCNPFTFGHRYLIEEAARKVDHLIIFVVEEDKSLFSFKERFAMVVEGTNDIDNISIVPSGNFILSKQTFPEYFVKVEDEDLKKNAEFDIKLFAEVIAPKLNIKYRFVGEEQEDTITNEYNEAMKKILPKNGIKLIELPRKKMNTTNDTISATRVRAKIEAGAWDEIKELVPQSTIELLRMSW